MIERERALAWERYQYADRRHTLASGKGWPEAQYWCGVKQRAYFAWDVIDDCYRAQRPGEFPGDSPLYRLERMRTMTGWGNYYAGQLPGPVDLSEPPEVVPLP